MDSLSFIDPFHKHGSGDRINLQATRGLFEKANKYRM